jgi:hypothetical protein
MGNRVHPVVVVLAILIVVVLVAMVYSRRSDMPKQIAAAGGGEQEGRGQMRRGGGGRGGGEGQRGGRMAGGEMGGGGQMGGGQMADTSLGIKFSRNAEPQGFKIDKFEGTPNPSPLKLMGLKEGDVITGCNGQKQQVRGAVVQAIQDLNASGKPIALTIDRGGNPITINWKDKLPAAAVVKGEMKMSGGGGRAGEPGQARGGRKPGQ